VLPCILSLVLSVKGRMQFASAETHLCSQLHDSYATSKTFMLIFLIMPESRVMATRCYNRCLSCTWAVGVILLLTISKPDLIHYVAIDLAHYGGSRKGPR
jgi:hypothetical protein